MMTAERLKKSAPWVAVASFGALLMLNACSDSDSTDSKSTVNDSADTNDDGPDALGDDDPDNDAADDDSSNPDNSDDDSTDDDLADDTVADDDDSQDPADDDVDVGADSGTDAPQADAGSLPPLADAGSTNPGECAHRATFVPQQSTEQIEVGSFCDELSFCMPTAAAKQALAEVESLDCNSAVPCAQGATTCTWYSLYDIDEDEYAQICRLLELSATDELACRVFLGR